MRRVHNSNWSCEKLEMFIAVGNKCMMRTSQYRINIIAAKN